MDEKMESFISILIKKTKAKDIKWTESNFESRFYIYKFNSGVVRIYSYYDDEEHKSYIILSIINNDGRIVYSYDEKDDLENIYITDLYNTINKQIYNSDEVIEGILNELEDI